MVYCVNVCSGRYGGRCAHAAHGNSCFFRACIWNGPSGARNFYHYSFVFCKFGELSRVVEIVDPLLHAVESSSVEQSDVGVHLGYHGRNNIFCSTGHTAAYGNDAVEQCYGRGQSGA